MKYDQHLTTLPWADYELIDSGENMKLERFGQVVIARPETQAVWAKMHLEKWTQAQAIFKFGDAKGGWEKLKQVPESWEISRGPIKFLAKLTGFKHVGIFPEQEFEWDLISKLTKKDSNILNLFGYTGVASLFALASGAKVTHVDASRPAITWFKDNQKASGLEEKPARIIIDDAIKFTAREIKRGIKYDGVVMDPPVYGHGPNGEKWSFNKDFPVLLDNVTKLLSDNPLFVIVNAYAISTSSTSIANIMQDKLKNFDGTITNGELTLKETTSGRALSTGIYTIWQSKSIL